MPSENPEYEPLTLAEAAAYGVPYDEGISEWPQSMHAVIRALEEHGELRKAELSEAVGLTKSTLAERVSLLVDLGIVTRRPFVPNPREVVYVFDPPEDGTRREGPASGVLRTDGGRVRAEAPGTAIKFDGESENDPNDWHHSTDFDGYRHTTACGIEVETRGNVEEVLTNLPESWEDVDEDDRCPVCDESIRALGSAPESGGESRGE